jgi:hypothetical protein
MKKRTHIFLLAICFTYISAKCSAQIAPVSSIQTAGGFLEVCGRTDTQLSKEQGQTVKDAPVGQTVDALKKAMDDRLAEENMCVGYVAGLIEGWKEGHEHGVVAAQFPDGWPKDEQKALAALPTKQLQIAIAAMKIDVPCIPDYVTIGQERDILIKFIRNHPLLSVGTTPRVIWLAFQEAFPCTLQSK